MVRGTLAGIGAASIVGSVLTAIAFELWFQGVLVFPAGPPRFEPIGLASYTVGSLMAARLGGWRGVAGIGLFVAVAFGYKLFFWLLRAVDGPDLEFFVGPAWAFGGVAFGAVLALLRRGGAPLIPMLQSAGAYAIGRLAWAVIFDVIYAVTWTGGERPGWMDWVDLSGAVWSAGLGIVVGLWYGARLDRWEIATVAASAALVSAVIIAHQGAMAWGDEPTFFLGMASGVIGGIGIGLGAMWARLRAQPSSLEFAAP